MDEDFVMFLIFKGMYLEYQIHLILQIWHLVTFSNVSDKLCD